MFISSRILITDTKFPFIAGADEFAEYRKPLKFGKLARVLVDVGERIAPDFEGWEDIVYIDFSAKPFVVNTLD
jgi:hypothetical protein